MKKLLLVSIFWLSLLVTASANTCICDSCYSCWSALNNQSCDVVRLTADITDYSDTCIEWPANNKVLDCQGHKIDGKDEWPSVGINFNDKYGNTIENCVITDFWFGIHLENSEDNHLIGNIVKSNYMGIILSESSSNTVKRNTLRDNSYAIALFDSNDNRIKENDVQTNYEGILVSGSENKVTDNVIKQNDLGMHLDDASSNLIAENAIDSNEIGIALLHAYDNIIATNNVSFNDYGIRVEDSTRNVIYNNYFDNENNTYLLFTSYDYHNTWNVTKRQGRNILGGNWVGGNYWSDYAGEDANRDGIGDVAYEIHGKIITGPMAAKVKESGSLGLKSVLSKLGRAKVDRAKVNLTKSNPTSINRAEVTAKVNKSTQEPRESGEPGVEEIVEYDYLPLVKFNPYAITIHFHYPKGWKAGDPLPKKDIIMIKNASVLNAHYVRFDVWWDEVQPWPWRFNESAIAYFKAIVKEIKDHRMQPLVVLGSGIPLWAQLLLTAPGYNLYLVKTDKKVEILKVPVNKAVEIRRMKIDRPAIEITKKALVKIPLTAKIEKIPTGKVKAKELIEFAKRNNIPIKRELSDQVVVQGLLTPFFLWFAERYAAKVASELGEDIYYYQLGNELNHPLNSIAKKDDPKYIRALYIGINSSDSEFETAINLFADVTWSNALIYYLNKAGDCIDIVGIDHYPGTWVNQPYDHWDELDTLFTITDRYGKKAAVLETGFSTYKIVIPSPPPLPPIVIVNHTEEMQKEFINTALPTIKEKVQTNGEDLTFITWYELIDEENPSVPIEAEKHFGILYTNFTKKKGYEDLKQQFGEWIW